MHGRTSALITISSKLAPQQRDGRTKYVMQVLIASTHYNSQGNMPMKVSDLDTLLYICAALSYLYYMVNLIHATPVHPSLFLRCF